MILSATFVIPSEVEESRGVSFDWQARDFSTTLDMTIYASSRSREDQSFAESSRPASDGFHEIETLIAPISLCDEIKIEQRSGKHEIEFRCDDPSVAERRRQYCGACGERFFRRNEGQQRVSIALKKKIPHGAGLGGGSSDAASTLLALNELFETNLPREALAKMAEIDRIGCSIFHFSIRRGLQRARRTGEPDQIARTIIAVAAEA